MTQLIAWIRVFALFAAVASAVFWFQSATIPDAVQLLRAGITLDNFYWSELAKALMEQAQLNQRAAMATGIAVVLHAIASLLASFSRG